MSAEVPVREAADRGVRGVTWLPCIGLSTAQQHAKLPPTWNPVLTQELRAVNSGEDRAGDLDA